MARAQVLNLEEEGRNNLTLRLKKRALQGAYDTAVKRKKVPPTMSCAGASCLAATRVMAVEVLSRLSFRQGCTRNDARHGLEQEEELRAKTIDVTPAFTNQHGHGVLERQPEDSVYYHPTLNPEGLPPPGKPQRFRTDPTTRSTPQPAAGLPVPAPPPLPAGPAPQLLPPPDSTAQGVSSL